MFRVSDSRVLSAGSRRITPVDGRRRGGRRGEQNGRDAVRLRHSADQRSRKLDGRGPPCARGVAGQRGGRSLDWRAADKLVRGGQQRPSSQRVALIGRRPER